MGGFSAVGWRRQRGHTWRIDLTSDASPHHNSDAMSKSEKSSSKDSGGIQRERIAWKTRLMRSPQVLNDLQRLKVGGDFRLIESLLPDLIALNKTKRWIVPWSKAVTIADLKTELLLAGAGPVRELYWVANVLIQFGDSIVLFHNFKSAIEKDTVATAYDSALHLLDECDKTLGNSLWSLQTRITLLGLAHGLEAQKEFANAIKDNDQYDGLVKFVVHYWSLCCEPRVSWWRYDTYVKEATAKYDPLITDYVYYLVHFFGPQKIAHIPEILAAITSFPVVDLYEAFIRFSQILACRGEISSMNLLQRPLKRLQEKISDPRLGLLSVALGVDPVVHADPSVTLMRDALDNYTIANYAACIDICERGIASYPQNFLFVELYAKSIARLGRDVTDMTGGGPVKPILIDCVHVLLKTSNAEKSAGNLRKIVYATPSSTYSAQLFAFLMREYVYDAYNLPPEFILFGELNSQLYNPRIAFSLPNAQAKTRYLQLLRTISPNATVLDFYEAAMQPGALQQLPSNIASEDRRAFYRARELQAAGNLEEARSLYRNLLDRGDYLLRQDALLGLNKVCTQLERFEECIDLLMDAYLENKYLEVRLPIQELISLINSSPKRAALSGRIGFPILLEVLCKVCGSDYNALRDDACEDFLAAQGFDTPSQLAEKSNDLPKHALIYFLRNVCVPEVLDSSIAYNSSAELLAERISVCQFLLTFDPSNAEAYSEEIKQLTQRLIIEKGVQEVEQSKIYVEVDGLRRKLDKSLRESFTRYCDLVTATPEKKAVGEMIVELGRLIGPAAEQMRFLIPGNEVQSLFREMVTEIRDEFVLSNEFGLNGYLSTGLRHGTIAGQLRAPFETSNLVTQRDDETKVYRDPLHWQEKYSTLPPNVIEKLSEALRTFSRRLDDLIDLVRTQWIQIHTEQRPSAGAFDYSMSDVRLAALQSVVTTGSYDEFIDSTFAYLWEQTERNLQNVRNRIDDELKPRLLSEVDTLEREIRESFGSLDCSAISTSITSARTAAQYAVDKMASWFRRAKASEIAPYTADFPIKIAIAMIQNIFPAFTFTSEITTKVDARLKGKTLTGFANILFILLENVRKHCAYYLESVAVNISFTQSESKLTLTVANPIASGVNLALARQKLQEVWNGDIAGSYDAVPREGGSGIQKIARILRIEMGVIPDITCNITDSRQFEFCASFEAVLIYEHSNN